MSDTQTPDPAHTAFSASPGEQLRREREAQGLSLADVAGALNLRPAVIRGLELDDYEEVPIPTYRRGYLRAYAHLLGIDDRPVLEAYRASFGLEDSDRKVTPIHVTRPPSKLGAWLFRLVTLLVIAGLIGLTLMWWQSRGGNEPPGIGDTGPVSVDSLDGTTTITEPDAPVVTADPESLPPLPEEGEGLGLVEDPAALADEPAELDADGALALADAEPEVAEEAAVEEEPAADPRRLVLTFNEQSWTEIFDANNQRIFVGLQEPGTSASVEGEPPFRLTVGNATGVELIWAGESVDLRARAGANNVARFTLGD
ncbi:RodZ domain-containing protein [Halomonas sp. BM-2019]|uniref:RodZ domain-containing protein n=1 Tax=Halomonas sp. BM-2019 TaxID=2811227 RepID=UPI001B3C37BB|nr:MAG: helix-turn-helix domain-containing protein [Halomonas sp. BM-2019]